MRIFITAFLCALTALPNLGHSQEKAIAYYDKKVTFSDKLAGVSPSITALPHFSKLLREGMTLHQFLQQGEASFSRLIERKDYIDTEEYTYHLSRETNQRRRQQLTTLLRYDENLDGTIEREEAIGTLINEAKSERSNPMTATHAELVKQADFLFVHHDRNKDGVITFTEMAELVKALEPFHRHPSRSDEIYGFLKVDTDGDGKITPEEARTILTGMFADADTNGDNTISKDEATSMKHRAETASKKSQCAVDKLDPKSRVIVLGVKGGEYYSSVDLTGAQEQVTAVRIKIEEQKKPLTLFLLSEKPTVFDIQGDTSKIQKVVIPYTADERRRHGPQRLSGVTNVPKERVTFESDICNYSIHDDSVKTEEHYTGAFLERFGRSPDLVVGQETAGDIVLHADRLEFAQKRTVMDNPSPKQNGESVTDADRLRWTYERDFPGGKLDIDPATVVSHAQAEPYQVYPGLGGLSQLLENGSIVAREGHRTYELVKPIPHFPSGLTGGNSVKFIIPDTLELPPGSLGHSCAIHRGVTRGPQHCQGRW